MLSLLVGTVLSGGLSVATISGLAFIESWSYYGGCQIHCINYYSVLHIIQNPPTNLLVQEL